MTKEQNDKVIGLIGTDIQYAYCYEDNGKYGVSIQIGMAASTESEEDNIYYDFWDSVYSYINDNDIYYKIEGDIDGYLSVWIE